MAAGTVFVQRGVADHDFIQPFGRIAADHEQLGHGDEVGYAVADGAMPAMASPAHTTFTNPPEAPTACAMGLPQGQGTLTIRLPISSGESAGGLADAHDLGVAVVCRTGPGRAYTPFRVQLAGRHTRPDGSAAWASNVRPFTSPMA